MTLPGSEVEELLGRIDSLKRLRIVEMKRYANLVRALKICSKHKIIWPECGFSIGAGWMSEVDIALGRMIDAGWDGRLVQVKQKFCGLRIYVGQASDEIHEIIGETEARCNIMCEECGASHGLSIPRTGVALCEECQKKSEGMN